MTTDTAGSGIREIDTGTLPDRYARGWHCLGPVKDYLDGRAARRRGVRHQAGGLRRLTRRRQDPRRVLPAHGRQPVSGHHQGRRDRLPVPRLALGRRRQVQAGALRQAHAATGPHARMADRCAQRPAVRLARPRGQPTATRGAHPGDPRVRQRRVDRLELELDAHRGLQLPRDHRQRHRHGALLLHPLRFPDVLQERLRGPHRLAVPAQRRPARRERPRDVVRRGAPGFGGLVLRPVVHDQLAAQQLRRLSRPSRS